MTKEKAYTGEMQGWKRWAIGFSVWTIVGLSFGTRGYLQAQFNGTPLSVYETVLSYMLDFYLWGIVSPVIFRICVRFPIEPRVLLRRMVFYVIFGTLLVLLLTAITIPIGWYLGLANRAVNPTLAAYFDRLMFNPFMLHQGLLAYAGTVAVAHAYQYYRQVQISRIRTSELSAQLAQAQLAALKMQIHPHFLFNTLNSISALLHTDVETADRMIARLSEFLRATLKSSDIPIVTLKQEIEFLRTYLEIEKIRFRDRLTVDIDVDRAAQNAVLPNLILQPLVENAVSHGIGRKASAGLLKIAARKSGNRLIVTISDNGPGISAKHANTNGDHRKGIGLLNTRARLKNFYEDFDLEIRDRLDSDGTIVKIDVPFLELGSKG